jgi:predicted RNA-binding protein YlxR (DUF448 family)
VRATPERTCVGCRTVATPAELLRIAATPDGVVRPGRGHGRGAWVCAGSPTCFDAAVERGALWRALRCPPLGDAEIRDLRARMFAGYETTGHERR